MESSGTFFEADTYIAGTPQTFALQNCWTVHRVRMMVSMEVSAIQEGFDELFLRQTMQKKHAPRKPERYNRKATGTTKRTPPTNSCGATKGILSTFSRRWPVTRDMMV